MIFNETNKYDDIINLPHPSSHSHPHMSMQARAAQFSPFAALTGYNEQVNESARLTDSFKELNSDDLYKLDMTINHLLGLDDFSIVPVTITRFVFDNKKEGGKYLPINGFIKRIDTIHRLIIMKSGDTIDFDTILNITIDD